MRNRIYKACFVLKPSPIHGVGVFTTRGIQRGTFLELFDPKEKLIDNATIASHGKLARHYGVKVARAFYCPANFHRMSIGWYLNHSGEPNTIYSRVEDGYYARRYIRKGEEITIDYGDKWFDPIGLSNALCAL